MGDWVIVVRGTGAHHNSDNSGDADRMADRFVRELQHLGHTIHAASFTYGAGVKLGEGDRGVDHPDSDFARAQRGYGAYAASTGGKTFDGREMPKWSELPDRIKAAWVAARLIP